MSIYGQQTKKGAGGTSLETYLALINQSNSDAPSVASDGTEPNTALVNTLSGGPVTYERISAGYYKLISVGSFPAGKTTISPMEAVPNVGGLQAWVETIYWDQDEIRFKTFKMAGDPKVKTISDNLLYLTRMKIEVLS
jgi:hypothetical protein